MFSIFKSNNPGVVVLYLIYIVAFRLFLWWLPLDTSFVFNYNEPLSKWLFGTLQKLGSNYLLVSAVLSGLLSLFQAILINGLVNDNKLAARKNYLPGLLFIIFSSFFKEALVLSPAQIALTFLILSTQKIFRLMKKEKSYLEIFDAGFLVAVASLFYFPVILFIVFVYVGMSTVRAFSYREWMAVLLGFIAPLFLAFTVYYYTDTMPGKFIPASLLPAIHFTMYDWIQAGALLACAAAAFLLLPAFLYSSLIQVRKFTTLLVVVFFFTLLTFGLQQHVSITHFMFLSLPAGIVSAMVLLQIKNKIVAEVIHLILILLVIGGQFLPLFPFN